MAQALSEGKIVALKGLGGYQLWCDARNESAIMALRQRKNREAKPFALMVATITDAERIVYIDETERQLLLSPARPIVLLKQRDNTLPDSIAQGLSHLGVMLPSTPLQYLMFDALKYAVFIVTSANIGGHGLVVICMSLVIGSGIMQARSPLWLETAGQWISIVFLLAFGLLTLKNLFSHSTALPAGLKGMLFKRLFFSRHPERSEGSPACVEDLELTSDKHSAKSRRSFTAFRMTCGVTKYNPFLIMLIGALFALSFDTFTQVALLSMSVSIVSEYIFVIMLGMVFMLGMMTSDGLNGFCVSKLIQLADQKSVLISRVMGVLIACFSLILGLLGIVKQL